MKNIKRKIILIVLMLCLILSASVVSYAERADQSPNVAVAVQGTTDPVVGQVVTGNQTATTEASTGVAAPSTGVVAPSAQVAVGSAQSGKVAYSTLKSGITSYQAKNSDVKAWLQIPNTNINFPIVKPYDNFTYVNRTVEGVDYPNNNYKNYKTTATYTDGRVVLGPAWSSSSKNIVLYGHNWTNLRANYDIGNYKQHVMFGQLPSYMSIDFARNNPYIYFSTENMEGVWKIFSVALIEEDYTVFHYNTPNPGAELYANMLKEFKARSIYNFDTEVNTSDRIITLDTCIRHYNNVGSSQRFVVVARLLRDGETDRGGVVVNTNPNVKTPKFS